MTVVTVPSGPALAVHSSELSVAERARADAFHFRADRDAYVAAHVLLRRTLAPLVGVSPGSLRFIAGSNGKPQLDHPHAALRFNLSHTRGMVAVAHALGMEVGVDVEAADRSAQAATSIAASYFAADEISLLEGAMQHERAEAFIGLWTRKEAIAKATGLGLSLPFSSFSVARPCERISSLRPGCDFALDSRRIDGFEVAVALEVPCGTEALFDWQSGWPAASR